MSKEEKTTNVKLWGRLKEAFLYVFFGGLTTLISWAAYSIFMKWIYADINWANVFSWVMAVAFAFITNKKYVFGCGDSENTRKELVAFITTRLATGVLEIGIVYLFVYFHLDYPLLGIEGLLTKIVTSIIVLILNYIGSKFFVFTKKEEKK